MISRFAGDDGIVDAIDCGRCISADDRAVASNAIDHSASNDNWIPAENGAKQAVATQCVYRLKRCTGRWGASPRAHFTVSQSKSTTIQTLPQSKLQSAAETTETHLRATELHVRSATKRVPLWFRLLRCDTHVHGETVEEEAHESGCDLRS